MKKTLATAIRILESAKEMEDINSIKEAIADAVDILREVHTGKRQIRADALTDVPVGKFMAIVELLQKGKHAKPPIQATVLAILIAKHGGKAYLDDLAKETKAYKTYILSVAKRYDWVVYDPACKCLELEPKTYERIKKILEG